MATKFQSPPREADRGAGGNQSSPWTDGSPAIIPNAHQGDLCARDTGAAYRIFISRPLLPPPPSGYPVVYVLDANSAFATMTDAVRLQSARPMTTGVAPALVVGIGYPTDLPLDPVRRTFDYTPPAARESLLPGPDGSPWPPVGGADTFLDFIEDELKPAIARNFLVDAGRQVLFGHSFGGLFALHALFTRPDAFQTYIAGSPSIWFGNRTVLETERRFTERLREAHREVRLMIGVGALEQTLSERERAIPELANRAGWLERNRMVDNAREMAGRLGALAPHGLTVQFHEFEGENHVSVIPALASRALRFALVPNS